MFSGLLSAFQLTYLLGSLTTIQSYICQPPTAPLIVTPIDGTSVEATKPFTVSGDGPFQSAIVISANGTDLLSVQADENNHFSAQVTLNTEGPQTLSVKSERTCGTAQGNTVNLTVDPAIVVPVDPTNPTDPTNPINPETPTNPDDETDQSGNPAPTDPSVTPPQPDTDSDEQGTSDGLYLAIKSPANNSTTTDSSIFVNGSTNAPSKVFITINGQIMAQTFIYSSTFGLTIPLSVGVNELTIAANAETGTATVKLTVTRQAEEQKTAWYQTEQGQTAIRIAVISLITILIIIVIIGIIIL